ncbi:MAG: sugar ABC transporter permease [Chloroflexi bacterium]|nr:sugar ABC transporter permease [Chloroflexota bacterium]
MSATAPAGARPSQRRLSERAREEIAAFLFISPWIIGFVVFTAGAMLFSFGLSFYKADLLTGKKFVGIEHYVDLFTSDRLFVKSLVNTFLYTLGVVPVATVLSLLVALLLNQGVWFQGIWRTIYYIPSLVSGVAVAILWIWLFAPTEPTKGLVNQFLSVFGIDPGPGWIYSETWALPAIMIMSLWGVGQTMLIYLAGLQSVPTTLYEACSIDGAGPLRRFWHVTIPLITPTIFFNVVINFIGSFQVFTFALVATEGGPNNATLTMVLYLYRKSFEQFHFGLASAIGWALFAIILILTLLIFRSSAAWVYYEGELRK